MTAHAKLWTPIDVENRRQYSPADRRGGEGNSPMRRGFAEKGHLHEESVEKFFVDSCDF